MAYEAEDRIGIIGDDREVEGETNGLPSFDNNESLDYLEEHEKLNGRYVHEEYNPVHIARIAKEKAEALKKAEAMRKAQKAAEASEAAKKDFADKK